MSDYTNNGGKWLGAARNWVQWNCHNGDTVTWGSNDTLHPSLTMRQVEELAARVADAAAREADAMKETIDRLRKEKLLLEIELSSLRQSASVASPQGGSE